MSAVIAGGRTAKASFWREFAGALACYQVGCAIAMIVVGSVGDAVGTAVVGIGLFTFWAWIAPRGAAVVLTVYASLATLGAIVAIIANRDWWRLVLIPFGLAAVVLAHRSRPLASSYIADTKRRERAAKDYDLKERWRLGSEE